VVRGRVIGILLLIGGLVLGLIGVAWIGSSLADGSLGIGGALIGGALLAAVILPVWGVGIFMLVRSARESAEAAASAELRGILDIVQSRGQVPVSDLATELKLTRDDIQRRMHELVGLGIFSGYVNWDEGVLYSSEAAGLRRLEKCRHCGGDLKLAGKGVITCPYCGTEYFLS
jgi:flavin-dependent dehydrogenase